jgi:three-Cys-motif partner protein
MTTPQETIWEIEPHTLAKHEILRRYLGAWFPILGTYNRRIVYIDGFCGPGQYKGGEPGSPIIALQEAINHKQRLAGIEVSFLFLDERLDRISHLENQIGQIQIPRNYLIHTKAGQFDLEFRKLLDDLDDKGLQIAPTFAFIDPFGFKGLPFEVIRRLLVNPKTEIFVTVMLDPINRFLEHPDPQTKQHIVELFGTDEVLRIAQEPAGRIAKLRLLYQEQLKHCARFVRFFEMRNRDGRTIYDLFFAGNHPLGHVRMKEAFWKVDPTSGYYFSDATNPDQLVMFDSDAAPGLAIKLVKEFSRHKIPVEQIRVYVENETPFVATHMRSAMRLLEDEKKIVVNENKRDGKKRRKNSFADDVLVEFD